MEPVEVAAHAPHVKSGRRWLDMAVSLAALVTSIASIAIAVGNNNSMERLVTANSWPFPILDNSNFVDGKSNVTLTIRNSGSGPAKLETVVVRYDGKVVRDAAALARACCAAPTLAGEALQKETGYVVTSTPSGQVLLPGETALVLSSVRTDDNTAFWDRLNQARYKVTFDACYCSVFDDCWTTNLQTTHPTPVPRCKPTDQIYKG